jgi:hypothetical protein
VEGLSLEQITQELSVHHPSPTSPPVPQAETSKPIVRDTGAELEWGAPVAPVAPLEPVAPLAPPEPVSPKVERRTDPKEVQERVERTVTALQHWLDAIHVARTDSSS